MKFFIRTTCQYRVGDVWVNSNGWIVRISKVTKTGSFKIETLYPDRNNHFFYSMYRDGGTSYYGGELIYKLVNSKQYKKSLNKVKKKIRRLQS